MRILLVEDDHEQAMLFTQVLQLVGYAVETTSSAEEAQVRLASAPFALLLADWDLADGMQGDALIRWAKARDPGIKTVLFSNHPQVHEIAAACGADASYQKTDGIARLRELIARLVPLPA